MNCLTIIERKGKKLIKRVKEEEEIGWLEFSIFY